MTTSAHVSFSRTAVRPTMLPWRMWRMQSSTLAVSQSARNALNVLEEPFEELHQFNVDLSRRIFRAIPCVFTSAVKQRHHVEVSGLICQRSGDAFQPQLSVKQRKASACSSSAVSGSPGRRCSSNSLALSTKSSCASQGPFEVLQLLARQLFHHALDLLTLLKSSLPLRLTSPRGP